MASRADEHAECATPARWHGSQNIEGVEWIHSALAPFPIFFFSSSSLFFALRGIVEGPRFQQLSLLRQFSFGKVAYVTVVEGMARNWNGRSCYWMCNEDWKLGKFTKVVARSLYNDIKEPVCAPNFVTIWSGNIAFVTRETYNNVYCIGHWVYNINL